MTKPPSDQPSIERTSASALGPYNKVSNALLLAAMDRAQRHRVHGCDEGAPWDEVAEHLGFLPSRATREKMDPQLRGLAAEGLIEERSVHGSPGGRLTSDGRRRLGQVRRREDLVLPEAPQHRKWRQLQARAAERIDEVRAELRGTLAEAARRLKSKEDGDSYPWFDLAERLSSQCELLGSATYCLHEWPEPDDARADVDLSLDPRRRRLSLDAASGSPTSQP